MLALHKDRLGSVDSECVCRHWRKQSSLQLNASGFISTERCRCSSMHISNINPARIFPEVLRNRVNQTVSVPERYAPARFVAAMVISRFDYCNSFFAGLPADQIARSQRVQNQFSQVYQQTRSLGHSGCRINVHRFTSRPDRSVTTGTE